MASSSIVSTPLLNCAYHQNICAWDKQLSPYTGLINSAVSAAVFPSLKKEFNVRSLLHAATVTTSTHYLHNMTPYFPSCSAWGVARLQMKVGHMDGIHCFIDSTSILVKIKSVSLYNCRTVYVSSWCGHERLLHCCSSAVLHMGQPQKFDVNAICAGLMSNIWFVWSKRKLHVHLSCSNDEIVIVGCYVTEVDPWGKLFVCMLLYCEGDFMFLVITPCYMLGVYWYLTEPASCIIRVQLWIWREQVPSKC